MSQQIYFYRKNRADLTNPNVVYTASQGNEFAAQAFNRSNLRGWQTTGSVDADNTTFEVDFVDERDLTDIFLLGHNFKSYIIKYWDGASYQDFSTPISETTYATDNSHHSFNQVTTSKVLLTIYGTQTADSDKILKRFELTEAIGQLEGWPIIKPKVSRNRRVSEMLSGKANVTENIGGFSCDLSVANWNNENDLTLIETLYMAIEGFLVWLCGGDENQFSMNLEGNRFEDIYLMKAVNEYTPERVRGLYQSGVKIKIKLVESIR